MELKEIVIEGFCGIRDDEGYTVYDIKSYFFVYFAKRKKNLTHFHCIFKISDILQ